MVNPELLQQYMRVIHDLNIISKSARDEFVTLGYIKRFEGFNYITEDGLKYLKSKNRLFGQ
jgi:hypothetical protein